tara:strand:+ start:309 stop:503 length:195 start_codon:yes stop_codon:yes gene_type:complete
MKWILVYVILTAQGIDTKQLKTFETVDECYDVMFELLDHVPATMADEDRNYDFVCLAIEDGLSV